MGRVSGKVAIVSGGANGIGRAAARRLAEEGAVVVIADIDEQNGRSAAAEINGAGGTAEFRKLDVTQESEWSALIEDVLDKSGRLDVLVNGASVRVIKPITELSLDEFHDVSMVNAYGTFVGARAAVLAMRKCAAEGDTPTGSIINVSSTAGLRGLSGGAAWCATKGAVKNMCKTMGVECGETREHIRINSVHPGDDADTTPLGSHATADDVAEAIVYLASDESRLVTGSELVVDSGGSLSGGMF